MGALVRAEMNWNDNHRFGMGWAGPSLFESSLGGGLVKLLARSGSPALEVSWCVEVLVGHVYDVSSSSLSFTLCLHGCHSL